MKQFFKLTVKRVLAMVLIMSMLLTANADLLIAYAAGDISMSAKIYQDSALENELTDLSNQTAGITGWEENTVRILRVNLDNLNDPGEGAYYQLVISMDRALYLSVPDLKENWVESYSQVKHASININKSQKRAANANSGTFTYQIRGGTTSVGVSFELNYDWVFWDQRENSVLGYNARYLHDTNTPLLSVKLQLVSGDTTTNVYNGDLKSATSGEGKEQDAKTSSYLNENYDSDSSIMMGEVLKVRYNGVSGYLVPGDYVLTVTAPSYTDSEGTTHYMEFDSSGDNFSEIDERVNLTRVVGREDENSPWVATYTFHNLYMPKNNPYYYIGFKLPESVRPYDENPVNDMPKFTGISITAKIVETVGEEETVYDIPDQTSSPPSATMVSSREVSLDFTPRNKPGMLWSQRDQVQLFDSLAIKNNGNVDTGEVTVRYRFDEYGYTGVTDVILNIPQGQTAKVYFKVWKCKRDGEGNITGGTVIDQWLPVTLTNSTGTDASGVRFSRKDLGSYNPEYAQYSSGDYYIKEINFLIDNIPKGVTLGGGYSPNYAGTIWGYIFQEEVPEKKNRVYQGVYLGNALAADGSIAKEHSAKKLRDATRNVYPIDEQNYANLKAAYNLDSMRLKNDQGKKVYSYSIEPGESAVLSARLWMRDYVYLHKTSASDIRLALLLPKDVTLNGVKGTLIDGTVYQSGGDTENSIGIHIQEQDDPTQNLWIITLPSHIELGYYQEGLVALEDGDRIDLEFTIGTKQNTAPKSIILDEGRLFAAGIGQPQINDGGYVGKHYCTYDTYNLLGLPADSSLADADRNVCKVLDSHSTITLSIGQSQAQLDITNQFTETGNRNTVFNDVDNTTRYEFDLSCVNGGSIKYFNCYIPVPKAGVHSTDFVSDTDLTLNMSGPAQITYSSAAVTRMKVLYTLDKELSYDAVSADDSSVKWLTEGQVTDWAKVTMMKLVPENENEYIHNGSEIKLSADFAYAGDAESYIADSGKTIAWNSMGYYEYENAGNTNSGHYSTDEVQLQLTYTAPEQVITLIAGSSDAADETKTLDIDEILSQYDREVSFTVQDVKIHGGFSLLPTQDTQWESLDSDKSNTQFGIAAQINSNASVDLIAGKSADLQEIGTGTDESVSFSIYHGNAITENASSMEVTLNLVGTNETLIPVRIHIQRVLTPAQPGQPAIVGGNQYALFDSVNENVSVSRDSAATAQFVVSYIPTNYECPELIITDKSVTGKIVMIDWSNTAKPVYYEADAAATITLSSFQKLDGTGGYVHSDASTELKQSLLFMLPQVVSDGSITFSMKQNGSEEVFSSELNYTVVNPRSFSLSADKASSSVGEQIAFSYSSNCALTGRNDSDYQNRQMSLVVSGTNIPADMLLDVNGVAYQMNAYGEYIISLVDAQNAPNGSSITVRPVSNTLTKQDITLTAKLYVGADLNSGLRPKSEQVADPVSVVLKPVTDAPAFKVLSMSTGRVLTQANLNKIITINTDWLNIDSSNITVELYKAEGFGYASSNFMNDGSSWSDKAFQMSLNALTATGTYQLRFTVEKNGVKMVIPYNFVLIDG